MVYIQSLGAINRYRINQAVPSVSSTSYDYWWSYPSAEVTPASTALLTATSDTSPDATTTGAQDAILSSDIPTASLIQITALPPATTVPQTVLPKLPYHRQVNILYLVPLFTALGVVLGAITAVIFLKWRRRLLRTSTLLPGPPYVPPGIDVEDRLLVHGYPSMEQVSLLAAGTPSKFTVHGSRYVPKRFAWQTLDTTRPLDNPPAYSQTIIPSSDGERFTVVTEEDPFFAPSNPKAIRQSPTPPNDVALPTIRVLPSLPEPISADNSSHHQAQETNLSKPFRRSMFDILKLKGPHRPTPSAHKEYTVLALDDESVDVTAINRVRRVSSLKETPLAGDSRFRGRRNSLDGGLRLGEVEDALGLLGTQGGKQDPVDDPVDLPKQNLPLEDGVLSSPTLGEKLKKPRKVTPSTAESKGSPKEAICGENQSITERGDETGGETHPDIYTKAPRRRSSRTPHKKIPSGGASRRYSAPDTHASVLPLSPPSLMSLPLEKTLFLTSPPASNASLAARMNSFVSIDSSPLRNVTRSPEFSLFPLPSKKKKAGKKPLRSSRPEPPLPYPSYPDLDHAQLTPQKQSTSAGTVSPGSPSAKGRSTSATHRESTTGISALGSLSPTSLAIALAASSSSDMLSKVNDIVAQGYIKRRESMRGGSDPVEADFA